MRLDGACKATFEFIDTITNIRTTFEVESPITDVVE